MNRKTIIDKIENDIRNNLTVANGYTVKVKQVKKGVNTFNDFSEFPVVCYTVTRDEPWEDNEHGEDIRAMTIIIYMYSKDSNGNTEEINNMVYDMENFLKNSLHFTYYASNLIGEIEIREGGLSNPMNGAWIEIQIIYDSN